MTRQAGSGLVSIVTASLVGGDTVLGRRPPATTTRDRPARFNDTAGHRRGHGLAWRSRRWLTTSIARRANGRRGPTRTTRPPIAWAPIRRRSELHSPQTAHDVVDQEPEATPSGPQPAGADADLLMI